MHKPMKRWRYSVKCKGAAVHLAVNAKDARRVARQLREDLHAKGCKIAKVRR